MKPPPDITDAAAMAAIGRRAALSKARREAAEMLRDASTAVQGTGWTELRTHADIAAQAADRLKTLAAMWAACDDEFSPDPTEQP